MPSARARNYLIVRNANVDALRGLALLGVLLVNLLLCFRQPLLLSLREFHTDPGLLNHLTDWLVGVAVDRKAFTILSLLLGGGMAALHARGVSLPRRFLVLLGIGLVHMLFIFDGDILVLYSFCGLLAAPLMGLSVGRRLAVAAAVLTLGFFRQVSLPAGDALVTGAWQAYGHGSYLDILRFRITELHDLILPLQLSVAPRTLALILLGSVLWQVRPTGGGGGVCFLIGGVLTALEAYLASHGHNPGNALGDAGVIFLGLGYSWLMLSLPAESWPVRLLAPVGRLSLTMYVGQNVLLGFLFYGYGLGLYGLAAFPAALVGLAVYALLVGVSHRVSYGPLEVLWRRLSGIPR